jgi:hypothetical protein
MESNAKRVLIVGSLAAVGLCGCVMVPVGADGSPTNPGSAVAYAAYPLPPVPGPWPYYPAQSSARTGRTNGTAPAYASPSIEMPAPAGPAAPAALQARLYPSNDIATQTGMLSGTVTNMMTGKGIFQLNYKGEILSGEATRVPGDDRRGVAHAYGQHGTYMSCDYRMTTQYQGTGTCSLSSGAQYQVHIGG